MIYAISVQLGLSCVEGKAIAELIILAITNLFPTWGVSNTNLLSFQGFSVSAQAQSRDTRVHQRT